MRKITARSSAVAAIAAGIALGSATVAGAAPLPDAPFPGWAECPTGNPETATCVNVVVKGGTMKIGKLAVDLPSDALQIAGGIRYEDNPDSEWGFDEKFVPPTDGSRGIYAKPIEIPGGALGIDLPFNNLFGLNKAYATVELAKDALPEVSALDMAVKMPAKLEISNPLLGNKCYLGSDTDPVQLDLDVTKSGVPADVPDHPEAGVYRNVEHGAAPFVVPAANGCGPFGILNPIVNWRASTPSAESKNSLTTVGDIFVADALSVPQP